MKNKDFTTKNVRRCIILSTMCQIFAMILLDFQRFSKNFALLIFSSGLNMDAKYLN